MKRRGDGFTLIELTVVFSVLSLVWLSLTAVLYTLQRADRRVHDQLQRTQSIDRFAMRLRLDAHAANAAELIEVEEGGHELVLSTPDRRSIHFGQSDEGIHRVVREGETVLHRDLFLISKTASEFSLRSPEEPRLIVVTLTTRDARLQPARVLQIKAAVASASITRVESPEPSS